MRFDCIRQFKELSGGLDLGSLLIEYINSFAKSGSTEGATLTDRLQALSKVADFETGSQILYCLINDEGASLNDIQDGMFRSGLLQENDSDPKCEPWQLVIVSAAFEINKQMKEIQQSEKKKVMSARSKKK